MATNIKEVIDLIVDEVPYDSTTFIDTVQDYLDDPDNGFVGQETITTYDGTSVIIADATASPVIEDIWIETLVDTSALISVDQWKVSYLEETYNQSMVSINKIGVSDSNSPNYPLLDYPTTLLDFDTTTSQDYVITPDTTGDIFIQYEFPVAEKVDGMYLQLGDNGCNTFGSLTNVSMLNYYIGYSSNGTDWKYITNAEQIDTTTTIQSILTSDQEVAKDQCFAVTEDCPIANETANPIAFANTAIEAKYWRLYMVDLLPYLQRIGESSGYTGYTASISHLRFDQVRVEGENLFDETVERVKTTGTFSSGNVAATTSASGAGWFTSATFTIESQGLGQLSTHLSGRIYADSTAEFRLQVQENAAASWVTVDGWEFFEEGNASLHDAREIVNPNSDLAPFTMKYRLQDRAATGTPTIEFRLALMTNFKSSETS